MPARPPVAALCGGFFEKLQSPPQMAQFLTFKRPLTCDTLVYVSGPIRRRRLVANRSCLVVHYGSS